MRVLILGAGAVGGYIGARLKTAGADVAFIARPERLASLTASGLVIKSPLGDFAAPVRAAAGPPAGFAANVAIIACKAPALAGAIETIGPGIGPDTRVLPFFNGVAHLETLHRSFPHTPMLGGIAHGALTLRSDGVIEHLTPFFSAIVGPTSKAPDPVAGEIVALLSAGGTDARLSPDIHQEMWNKFVFLATLAGMTCLMRASIGTIVSTNDGRDLILQLLTENLSVARAEHYAPDQTAMASYRQSLTEPGSTFTSSMLRDVLSGRRTEADHILGDMLRRARRHGLETPVLKTAYAHLQCHEATIAR